MEKINYQGLLSIFVLLMQDLRGFGMVTALSFCWLFSRIGTIARDVAIAVDLWVRTSN